ncbi:hypothetical protein [Microbacterium gorillae]|uniref:hypothetical protein n=1 Tax=Microbacterium gorillae TaxID=1231063 RepID=UPI000693445B|nr:hypothetical protein [Microbacterium gorillae]
MIDLDSAALLAETDPAAALDSLPWLTDAIAADTAAGAWSAWGPSTVIDENTGAPVIGRGLFEELHRRAGLVAAWPVGNGGLIHCYGYLLSRAETPYGLKRDRWLTPDLARAYGLPDDAFAPQPAAPTLSTRVAAAMSRALADSASVEGSADGVGTRVAFVSHGSSSAVAYAVADRLITTFPVGDPGAVRAEIAAGPPRLRWNAVTPTPDAS